MADQKTLQDAFLDELRDVYDAEKQLTKALPKMAKAASSEELRTAFEEHLEETRGQIARLEQAFANLNEEPRGKHCEGIAGIIEEGKSILEEDFEDETLDACLIAAGQRAEHYEMAAYEQLPCLITSLRARDLFLRVPEQLRRRYPFTVAGVCGHARPRPFAGERTAAQEPFRSPPGAQTFGSARHATFAHNCKPSMRLP